MKLWLVTHTYTHKNWLKICLEMNPRLFGMDENTQLYFYIYFLVMNTERELKHVKQHLTDDIVYVNKFVH